MEGNSVGAALTRLTAICGPVHSLADHLDQRVSRNLVGGDDEIDLALRDHQQGGHLEIHIHADGIELGGQGGGAGGVKEPGSHARFVPKMLTTEFGAKGPGPKPIALTMPAAE